MKIKAIFSLIACGLVASTTAAVSLPGPVLTAACSGATEIFYVNGVFNSKFEPRYNRLGNCLRARIGSF